MVASKRDVTVGFRVVFMVLNSTLGLWAFWAIMLENYVALADLT